MHLPKPALLAATASAAAAAAVFALATPATAASDYTVSPGGAVTASLSSANIVFTDTTAASKPKLTCTGLSGGGTAVAGGHAFAAAPAAGSITVPADTAASVNLTGSSLTGCTNATVGAVNITPSGSWKLWLNSKSATGGHGFLGGVKAHVAAASGTCQFDAAGYIDGTYTNSTGALTANTAVSGLKISNVSGTSCPLVGIANGHFANVTGAIKIKPIQTIS